MTLTEGAEELLETMWTKTVDDGEECCRGTAFSDKAALKEIIEVGCVLANADALTLTDIGMEEARGCVRRHRLAERLLVDVLQLRNPLLHETGCQFEHLLHRGLDKNICTLLGHPRTCPHGRAIPEGTCCREARQQVGSLILPLPELKAGTEGVIAYLRTDEKDALQKLISMGVLPGVDITLLQRVPSLVFRTGRSQFAIDKELGSHIHVRLTDHDEAPAPNAGRRERRRRMGSG